MSDLTLELVIKDLAATAAQLSPAELELPWKWGSYDSEGVRFAFFRINEQLRTLAVRLRQARLAAGHPVTQTQSILAYYHAAYSDLNAALLGLDEAGFITPPSEGEWPVRRTLAHILNADMGFYVVVNYTLARQRSGDGRPQHIPDEAWEAILGLNDAQETALIESPAQALMDYFASFHNKVMHEFSTMADAELELDSFYWEDEPYPLRFRLHRFESHLRQHTIQIDKTLTALGHLPAEPLRLMRMIYASLADAEAACLGARETGAALVAQTAAEIADWTRQIQ
jgi:hypothetical protein